ncbi:MAG TPA: zinc ribbon domain-containing protein [Pyrinomonadaceae bacterium]|nr:zinc ribbon domain-containing protein [Pyrinomonadaceae bacterium]
MYCPKCSQKQIEDDLRFCSRCGFQLGVVKELLTERDSAPVTIAELDVRPKFFSRRKQDLLLGATVMSLAATMVVLFSWIAPKGVILFPLWMAWFAFSLFVLSFDGLVRVARALFSDDDHVNDLPSLQRPRGFMTKVSPATSELPPMRNVPLAASDFERVNTGEILQPLSVTDHTTNLLNKK